jgi:hypothetical protein
VSCRGLAAAGETDSAAIFALLYQDFVTWLNFQARVLWEKGLSSSGKLSIIPLTFGLSCHQ